MSLVTQPYKGARDLYPKDKRIQKYMFGVLRSVVESFGYEEYDAPLIEPLEIYSAKSGEEIVNEQTYTFEDRGGRKVAIRPEMTPSVSRMVAAKRQELGYPLRLYSIPNLWRYERPQRGRLREHWQLNVDIFGVESIEADLEVIQIADKIMQSFNANRGSYTIKLNSRKFVDEKLDLVLKESDKKKDVVRLIDNKNKMQGGEFEAKLAEIVSGEQKSKILDFLNSKSSAPDNLTKLISQLKKEGISNVEFDISLMRGLDYYTDIVFEVYDNNPENNRSMFGGGRYDGLVGMFGVEPLPTVGFGMGDVTLQNFLETNKLLPAFVPETDLYVVILGDVFDKSQKPINQLRDARLNVAVDFSNSKIDKQIKNAVKKGIKYVLFIGDEELKSNRFTLKNLDDGTEQKLSVEEIIKTLKNLVA